MKILFDEYEPILDFLKEQRSDGYEFVGFPSEQTVRRKEDLVPLQNSYDANEYCYENSTDVDRYEFLAIRSVYRAMSEARQDKSLLMKDGEVVDVGEMVREYHRRLESKSVDSGSPSEKDIDEGALLSKKRESRDQGLGI